jgi:hypothetical protein
VVALRRRGTALALASLVAACSGEAEPRDRSRDPSSGSRGAEASYPAVAYPVAGSVPTAARFEALVGWTALAPLAAATRAGAWSALRRGGEERRSAGNFLCRLETLFGPAPVVEPGRVAFVLRDRETALVLTAVADASGPAFGAVVGDPPDPALQTQAAQAVLELAALVDATEARDCRYTLAGVEVGVRAGTVF